MSNQEEAKPAQEVQLETSPRACEHSPLDLVVIYACTNKSFMLKIYEHVDQWTNVVVQFRCAFFNFFANARVLL